MANNKAYSKITDTIINALEAGVVPWHRPWVTTGCSYPTNVKTKRQYRGVNVFVLWATAQVEGYTDARWGTFKQIQSMGGSVIKGSKGTPVLYWCWLTFDEGTEDERKVPFAKWSTVFNIKHQTEGIELDAGIETEILSEEDRIQCAEDLMAGYFENGGPTFLGWSGGRACYHPTNDEISLPDFESFESPHRAYLTAFHEMAHSTGHESRLDRKLDTSFGSDPYAREELVAELAACFLAHETGIDSDVEQSAAYIESWAKRFREDPSLFPQAASRAEKAVRYVMENSGNSNSAESEAA